MTHFNNNASSADHVGTISAPISVPNDPIKDALWSCERFTKTV